MFEHITYEELLKRMLDRALSYNKNLDSREGSLLFLAEAPAAVELQNLYIALDTVLTETFADTASREYLKLRARERALEPYPATAAVLEMTITPADLPLEMGERFSIGELNYFVSEYKGGGVYAIACETTGEAGNDYGPTVIPIEYVPGLETCTITTLLIPGEDEEETPSTSYHGLRPTARKEGHYSYNSTSRGENRYHLPSYRFHHLQTPGAFQRYRPGNYERQNSAFNST